MYLLHLESIPVRHSEVWDVFNLFEVSDQAIELYVFLIVFERNDRYSV